jgi:hypothetical protein
MAGRILGVLLAWLLASGAIAHELESNRLTLVLRDRNHLSMTFHLDYTGVLHRALAPKRTLTEFILACSVMKPEELEKDLLRAQAKFQSATRLVIAPGQETAAIRWSWPEPRKVHAMLQERAMQRVVAPDDHAHDPVVEIRAEAVSAGDVGSVTIQFPEEFQRVLVVSYRPAQSWVQPGMPSGKIGF